MKPEEYGGIVRISAALREYYGLQSSADPDEDLQNWLNENRFRCVVLMLVDGMGTSILEKHMKEDSLLRGSVMKETSTVFPPTTTAATTSLLTGKYPKETGWLGWNQYFPEIQDEIILFYDQGQYSRRKYPGFAREHLPFTPIYDELNTKGIRAESVWPGWSDVHPCASFAETVDTTLRLASEEDCRFIYSYWDELDTHMHQYGPSDRSTGEMLQEIETEIGRLFAGLPEDCGVVIVADHSQIDVRHYDLGADGELTSALRHTPCLEGRCSALYIREGTEKLFEDAFRSKLGDSFDLMSREEVIRSDLFGRGTAHPRFEEFIGDYLAVAVNDVQLDYMKGSGMKGNHAGGLREEAMIPVIVYPSVIK